VGEDKCRRVTDRWLWCRLL